VRLEVTLQRALFFRDRPHSPQRARTRGPRLCNSPRPETAASYAGILSEQFLAAWCPELFPNTRVRPRIEPQAGTAGRNLRDRRVWQGSLREGAGNFSGER
jgi:hypothetical protein